MNNNTDIEIKKKKRSATFLFQLGLVIVVLALIWFSFGQNVLSPENQDGIPQRLGELELVSSVSGEQAIQQLGQLHGTGIELVDAYIAGYSRDGKEATIWIGETATSDNAVELLDRMVKGIADGNSTFGNLRRITVTQNYHSHEVFQVDGAGGRHFFFISRELGTRLVWLTVQADDAMSILEETINTF